MSSVERQVTLGDYQGIHGRTARTIVSIVKRHGVRCTLSARHPNAGRDASGTLRQMTVDGESILNIMMLAAPFGSPITVRVEGERAEEALNVLAEFLAYGPYGTYVTIDRGSNSDPALRDIMYDHEAMDAHIEMLHAVGAANITEEHQQRRRERANPELRREREARRERLIAEIEASRALRRSPGATSA